MPKHEVHHFVPYTPTQMLAVVADVESYPEFLPHCAALKVLHRQQSEQGREQLLAIMTVRYMMLQEKFTSRIEIDRHRNTVDVGLVSGPFQHLTNQWQFETSEGGTMINFKIDYAFRSAVFGFVAGTMFEKLFASFERAFEDRAKALYTE